MITLTPVTKTSQNSLAYGAVLALWGLGACSPTAPHDPAHMHPEAPAAAPATAAAPEQPAAPAVAPATAAAPEQPSAPAARDLPIVEASEVCMVNDKFFARPQIPVKVEGRTYYGCCPNCEAKLLNEAATRTAKDPVSGEPVDKATAVILALPGDAVLYFASHDNASRYWVSRDH
ncbi:MAG: TRASH domain-containing protein [Deltaproteobacteria bacterium]|nr:TRASH domain-containing protein [Deltaproteobacteria bacterium]MCB9789236.1 TRASH domain-containing protein [Deltaproteobacteria bacterium]